MSSVCCVRFKQNVTGFWFRRKCDIKGKCISITKLFDRCFYITLISGENQSFILYFCSTVRGKCEISVIFRCIIQSFTTVEIIRFIKIIYRRLLIIWVGVRTCPHRCGKGIESICRAFFLSGSSPCLFRVKWKCIEKSPVQIRFRKSGSTFIDIIIPQCKSSTKHLIITGRYSNVTAGGSQFIWFKRTENTACI